MQPSRAATNTSSVARPCNIDQPPVSLAEIASGSYRDDPLVRPRDLSDVPDEDEYQTLPNEVPEDVLE